MKAIILFSGGIDSTVALAIAHQKKRECYALSFDYGQRHKIELKYAKKLAAHYNAHHILINIDPSAFQKSALMGDLSVPKNRSIDEIIRGGTPPTYVPGRNTLFLSYALSQAEIWDAQEIYVGANAMDKIYPDCLPEYLQAFQALANRATKQASEGHPPQIIAPLIHWNKKEIIQAGLDLKAPLELTWTCYMPTETNQPCGQCDACLLRQDGFKQVEFS